MFHKSLKKTAVIAIMSTAAAFFICFSYFGLNNRVSHLQNPEDEHLIGNGVYFNIFTDKTRNEKTTGIFSKVDNNTIFYASIQNSGKDRHMKLKGYLNYFNSPLEFLDTSYSEDDIYLLDGDNILIPFKITSTIKPDTNYKLLLSLFIGTDQYEETMHYQTTQHTLSYDYFIQNTSDNQTVNLTMKEDENTQYTLLDSPGVVLNTDFKNTASVKLPPYKLTVKAGESFKLSYKIGHITGNHTLLLVTINYQQAVMNNNAAALLINTPEDYLASGIITLTAPSKKGRYEVCAVAIPSPTLPNVFELLENAYRFTLYVQ